MGMLYHKAGLQDDAVLVMNESLKIRRQLGDVRGIAVTNNNLGNIYFTLGEHQTALQNYLESIRLCREVGILDVQLISLRRIALLFRTMGDIENAELVEAEISRLETPSKNK
jgi:tetratricopeptide (TPR) repeat protein